ncbi:MAG: AAA family ATPase [Bacteroidaceae bacterium]|nr:AAA family ATPase [Bacteroidaceae bacterium]
MKNKMINVELPTPADVDLEEVVVGTCLLESTTFGKIADILGPEMFYDMKARLIFTTLNKMFNAGKPIDLCTVKIAMEEEGTLEQAGGPYHLALLSSKVAGSMHVMTHALIVKEMYMRREMRDRMYTLQARSVNLAYDIADTMIEIHNLIDFLEGVAKIGENMQSLKEIMDDTIRDGELRCEKNKQGLIGIPTGLKGLDEMTAGFQGGELVVLAARPGVGKSAMMLHMAMAAAKAGNSVLIFSLEMLNVQLGNRILTGQSNVDSKRWKAGTVDAAEMDEAKEAARQLAPLPISIDDNADVTTSYVRSCIRSKIVKDGCDVVYFDYLQVANMGSEDGKANWNRELEVSQATRRLKLIAKEFNIPVVMLSQLNRDAEERKVLRPEISQLRESGAIEQNADIVLLLYRPALLKLKEDPVSKYPSKNLGVIIVGKNRNGETGDVYFNHNDPMTKFEDYVPPIEWMNKNAR